MESAGTISAGVITLLIRGLRTKLLILLIEM